MILINSLSYQFDKDQELFANVSLSIRDKKIGLVGANGVGKSTLLKLILGDLKPTQGTINVSGTIGYLPQNLIFNREHLVKDVLGVTDKLDALERISAGSVDKHYYDIIGDDWNLIERIEKQLSLIGLNVINLNAKLSELSGGEITWLALSSLFLHDYDVLLLDEPTNNLDVHMREILTQYLGNWKNGALIVSHDRTLLEYVDSIAELTSNGLINYGGNFSVYKTQKDLEASALQHTYDVAIRTAKKVNIEAQRSLEKKAKKDRAGKKQRKDGGQAKIILNKAKERSEFSKGKADEIKARKISDVQEKLTAAKDGLLENAAIDFTIGKVDISSNKIIVNISELKFKYQDDMNFIINNFDLMLQGHARVGIVGKNGSGKSTLLHLIYGTIKPTAGTIYVGTTKFALLDQAVQFLDVNGTVLQNVLKQNPKVNESKLRERLAQFLFGCNEINKTISELSGGERVRVGLAALLVGDDAPELLMLDEPTNHMDLYNLQSFTQILRQYRGALIVVSHDNYFIDELNLSQVVNIENKQIIYREYE